MSTPLRHNAAVPANEVLSRHKALAEKAIRELYEQAKAGYGSGNAVGEVADSLTNALPSNVVGYLPDALKKVGRRASMRAGSVARLSAQTGSSLSENNMNPLRSATIRLAHAQPKGSQFRKDLLNILADYDPNEISDLESGAFQSDADEPYMRENFTEQETTELSDKQESGQLPSADPNGPTKYAADDEDDDGDKEAALRSATIRLAHTNPALRKHLLPLLK